VPSKGKPSHEFPPRSSHHDDAPVIISLRKREKRAVSVARAILHDIREDRLVAGDRLPPEVEMLERYQVARGTLREALRILEVQSLISIKHGRDGGPVVNTPTPRDFSHVLTLFLQGMDVTMQDLLDARRSVEPVMARLAAQSHDQEKLDDLAEILERTEKAKGWEEIATATADFHRRILTMSGNPVLDLWAATLQQTVDYREGPPFPKSATIRNEHIEIGQAILDHDEERAAKLMTDHMEQIKTRTRDAAGLLRQRIEWR
jgi:DNA-binding FadR family transcriptional regulator